jgi:hypothetical protein
MAIAAPPAGSLAASRTTIRPPAWRGAATLADRLDELLTLRDAVDQLAAAELPKGFGRD